MFIFPFQDLIKAEIPSIQKGPVLQKLTVECPFTSPQRQVGYLLSSRKAVPAGFFYWGWREVLGLSWCGGYPVALLHGGDTGVVPPHHSSHNQEGS